MIQQAWKASRRAWKRSALLPQSGESEARRFRGQIRWSLTAATRQAAAAEWFEWLEQPAVKPYLQLEPRMAFRPLRAYGSTLWNLRRRTKVVRDTYAFIHAYGGALHQAMTHPEGALLLRLPLERGVTGEVRLKSDAQYRKEGEISAFFHLSGVELPVSSFALAFERTASGWACYVGAVQGQKGGGEEAIKLATKAMHGLRPKQFMVFLAQEIARSLRVNALYGVGNRIQVARADRRKATKAGREISFDYDELWTEAGGEPMKDGWFLLPAKPRRRGLDEVKPNKRSMYAKRYAMLDDISRQIRTVLTPFPRS